MTNLKVTVHFTTSNNFRGTCREVRRKRKKLVRRVDNDRCERIMKLWFETLLSVFWRIVMAAAKTGLTNAMLVLCKVLNAAKGSKTIDELAIDYGKAMKKTIQPSSMTTNISLLRKAVAAEGKAFPKSWEPKHKGGGGRTSVRTSLDEALNSMGVVFDDLPEDETAEGDSVAAE